MSCCSGRRYSAYGTTITPTDQQWTQVTGQNVSGGMLDSRGFYPGGTNLPVPNVRFVIPGTNIPVNIGDDGQPMQQPGIFDQISSFVRNNQGLVLGGLAAAFLLRRK